MAEQKTIIKNFGILASISWNSNHWSEEPTTEDLKASKYDFVKDNAHMHESLNFGHEIYPSEDDGFYIGYTPMFNRPPAKENSKNVKIVFFSSSNYRNNKKKTIVGFYGNPIFGAGWVEREAEHPKFEKYDSGNVLAKPKDIIYFENPIIIDNEKVQKNELLPNGKKISQQGFNYLNSDNVYNLINLALLLNTKNKKLKQFVNSFEHNVGIIKQEIDLNDFLDVIGITSANTLKEIEKLEKKMRNQPPEIKQRISSFIERGAISNKVKKLTNYKCLICEAIGENPYSFEKTNGINYVETHHVEPVSTLKKGVLGIGNLITVCANHHRQLHYGKSELINENETEFEFKIDDKRLIIEKITLPNN
jgi:5-methylcytosine-specific restriction protein A